MSKGKKIALLATILIVITLAAYFLLFYKRSPQALAASLGLYTGDPGEDQLLDNMINAAMNSGGSIAADNLEWELTDAANRMKTGNVMEVVKVNGRAIPAGALLTTIDIVHDGKKGYPDDPDGLWQTNLAIVETGPVWQWGATADTTDMDAAQAELDALQLAADNYISQPNLNILWDLMNRHITLSGIENIVI